MVKRILIAVGGTGGHIYPALALAKGLQERDPSISLLFAGGGLQESPFFDRAKFPYSEIACGSFPLAKPQLLLRSVGRAVKGVQQGSRLIREFSPRLVVGFGSYHTLPLLLSAMLCSIPFVLHEGNAVPGRVNRLFSRRALLTAVQFPDAAAGLKGKSVEVEPPLREGLRKGGYDRKRELAALGLSEEKMTLLAFGGSQGAVAINRLVSGALARYPGVHKNLQVIHLTGSEGESEKISKRYSELGLLHFVKDFDREIGPLWSVADFVIGRSGAGTVAEAMEFEVPALLIPYPHATDGHQRKNGLFMSERVKGACLFDEGEATEEKVASLLQLLFEREPEAREKMQQAIVKYKEGQRQRDFSALIAEIVSE